MTSVTYYNNCLTHGAIFPTPVWFCLSMGGVSTCVHTVGVLDRGQLMLYYVCLLCICLQHIVHKIHSKNLSNEVRTLLAPLSSGAAKGGRRGTYGWTSKNYVICVCFHGHGTSSYHTTNTLQGRRARSHVDTQTIQPGLGDFVR